MRNAGTNTTTEYVIYQSINLIKSTQESYMENTIQVIESLLEIGIRIISIVGDGLSAQRQGLSPSSETFTQNS
jgi:hypothetical protein